MEISGVGKSPNSSLSFRYNANNEELEELYHVCEDDPPTPQCDPPSTPVESTSPKRGERSSSIIDKYFKSIRSDKALEKFEDAKPIESKPEEAKASLPKEVTSSPMKEYLNRLGKRSTPDVTPDVKEGKESNETWKIFHDFKFKIAQAVEDMKTRSVEDTKEKSIPRENSTSDSEENSAIKDLDQQSVGDTDNQVSSLDSSIQNLSEMTQPLTAKATERDPSLPADSKNYSDSSDDTHKNLVHDDEAEARKELLNDSHMEVESGIEALEDNIDGFGDIQDTDPLCSSGKPLEADPGPPPPACMSFGSPPSKNNMNKDQKLPTKPNHFCNFSMYFLTFLIFISFTLFPNSSIWNGFVLGLWCFCFTSSLKSWVLDTYFSDIEPKSSSLLQLKRSSAMPTMYTIPSVKEHTPLKKYEGWINHYRFPDYDPYTYHISKTTTAFMKLEGCNLRISYTSTKIPKRALWDEKLDKVAFYQHRLYNLTGARVTLLPSGLVRRRQWSKKYPICIILNDNEKIQVLEKETSVEKKPTTEVPLEKKKEPHQQHEMETETNASPEKKRKFVWRRREKSNSHSEGETGKEGLRHRLVRKMHRDKKTDNVSTATEPVETQSQSTVKTEKPVLQDDSFHEHEVDLASASVTSTKDENEDDFDDNELSRIKDFLEETEREIAADGTSEGEWSVHVKYSKDKHSHLYIFTRTARDKHEWYRRLAIAIKDANAASAENSVAEDKTGSESTAENKDNIEMAVYKVTEKETVAFNKSSNKAFDSSEGGVTISSITQSLPQEIDYEKTFWPYLLKIIQNKNSPVDCSCRLLPSEVTWVNTVLARIMFDMMRNPTMITRLQNKIQRKLNTLKLPSFMSPLMVTELSLAGACPLVERVQVPTWDSRGVWLDADIRYDGGAYIAILTQINLMKLKEKNMTLEEHLMEHSVHALNSGVQSTSSTANDAAHARRLRNPAIYDSDMEDSAESSDDDESPPVQPVDSNETLSSDPGSYTPLATETTSSKKKFLRMVDKIATNKYFQQVTEYKYVKRAMEGLSNTDIKLHLEVHALEGRLAFNLPPPPHDRIWFGFRTNPQLVLKARPAVGARTLRFAHITNWIEEKLSKEFEKFLVLPNMEDLVIDIMTPTPVDFE